MLIREGTVFSLGAKTEIDIYLELLLNDQTNELIRVLYLKNHKNFQKLRMELN